MPLRDSARHNMTDNPKCENICDFLRIKRERLNRSTWNFVYLRTQSVFTTIPSFSTKYSAGLRIYSIEFCWKKYLLFFFFSVFFSSRVLERSTGRILLNFFSPEPAKAGTDYSRFRSEISLTDLSKITIQFLNFAYFLHCQKRFVRNAFRHFLKLI
jgi:hypothetical protein